MQLTMVTMDLAVLRSSQRVLIDTPAQVLKSIRQIRKGLIGQPAMLAVKATLHSITRSVLLEERYAVHLYCKMLLSSCLQAEAVCLRRHGDL